MFNLQLSKRKKFITLIVTIILTAIIVAIVWCIYLFQTKYVFMGRKIYERDELNIKIDCQEEKYNRLLKKINRFTQIEKLDINNYDQDDYIQFISSNSTIKELVLRFSDIKDTSFMNTMSGLKLIHCLESDIDFNKLSSKYINTIELLGCNIKNLDMLKNCRSLMNLEIYKGSYEGMIKSKEDYVLQDSSIFSELDTVVELDIHDLKIKDIKGFIDMDSLKKINVTKDSMSQEQIHELTSDGIQVIVH